MMSSTFRTDSAKFARPSKQAPDQRHAKAAPGGGMMLANFRAANFSAFAARRAIWSF
jgi:hypothetical protein